MTKEVEEKKIEVTSLLVHNVPTRLKRKFKKTCAMNEKSMRDVIVKLMKGYIRG